MKFATLAALVATAATASAKVFLGPINDQITLGSTVNVEWMVDCDEVSSRCPKSSCYPHPV